MVFQLTNQEGQRLTAIMLAMRPDWVKNNPEKILADANMTGLPGQDFGHSLRALAAYCTARDESGWQYRTPNLYIQDGKYWTSTAPTNWVRPKAPMCKDHPESEAPTCRGCHADVKVGDRPADMIGRHYTPPPGIFDQPLTEALALAGASTISTEN